MVDISLSVTTCLPVSRERSGLGDFRCVRPPPSPKRVLKFLFVRFFHSVVLATGSK